MSATNFNTKNDTFRKLMGNGLTYRIPRFQRDYSWTEEEWEDLWLDVQGAIRPDGEAAHYMGYLVLQSSNDKSFDVIDGQQRLTTLSIVVLAVLKNLARLVEGNRDAERNRTRQEQIRQTYVGYLDPVTLIPRSKLQLNRNNDRYFQTYLVPLAQLPQRGFRASEHSLRKAFEWFDARVQRYATAHGGDEGVALATLVETMSDKLFFTVITVTDELNAYKVFETLNARGVRLSATDLLKNYLFSVLHREENHEREMTALEDRWESMVSRLGSESFPDFLRVHWNSRKPFVRQAELFKTIRAQVTTREQAFDLLRLMEQDMDTYLALTHPEGSDWERGWKNHAATLKMFYVRQPYPLLVAVRRMLQPADFASVLRACVVISLRYNVIGGQPTYEQERVYNQVAERVSLGELAAASHVLEQLKPLYPSDASFKAAFAERSIRVTQPRNRRVVRYILCELERHACGLDYDFESESFNIEHVLPQHPDAGWTEFTDEEAESLAHRLGNVALLDSKANKNLGNKSFADKLAVYEASSFELTRRIAEDDGQWTPQRIAARQSWMANQATAVWRIPQLG